MRVGAAPAKPMQSEYVSGNYFATLGVGAYAGRPLNENDDTPAAAPALVLSYQDVAGGLRRGPEPLSAPLSMCRLHPFTVAGIAPPGFFGDRIIPNPPDFWMPLASEPVIEGANSALKQSDEAVALSIGQSAARHKHWRRCRQNSP